MLALKSVFTNALSIFLLISPALFWSSPMFLDQSCFQQLVLKKLISINYAESYNEHRNQRLQLIRVVRPKSNYSALCFVAPKKVQSQKWPDASLSSHHLLSLSYFLLQAFPIAPKIASTPRSTHSLVVWGYLPC